MEKRPSHSHLQNRILLYLDHHIVDSVAGLSRELGTHRSSVSRALHALLDVRLVSKIDGNWNLTEEGKEEAQRIRSQVPERTEKAVVSVKRLIEQSRADLAPDPASFAAMRALAQVAPPSDIGKALAGASAQLFAGAAAQDFQKALIGMSAQLFAGAAAQDFQKALTGMSAQLFAGMAPLDFINTTPFASVLDSVKTVALQPTFAEVAAQQVFHSSSDKASSLMAGLGSQLAQEALGSFSQSQRLNLSSIEQVSAFSNIAPFIIRDLGQTNIGLSRIIDDLGIIKSQGFASQFITSHTATLMPNVAEVARTYKGLFADVMSDLGKSFVDQTISLGVAVPTRTTSALIGSVRTYITQELDSSEDSDLPEEHFILWQERAAQLDGVFRALGPNYIAMWHGSWAVLNSQSPDRIRQAAHSGRELLMQLLAELAPDSAFDAAEVEQQGHNGKVTRKMRVRKILGRGSVSALNWADAIIKALEEMYERLAAVSHDRNSHPQVTEQQIAGLLHALGGLLMFLDGFRR